MSNPAQKYSVVVEPVATPEVAKAIISGLVGYNTAAVGPIETQEVSIALRDAEGNVCGGILGAINWNWLFIKILWIAEEARGLGYGRSLMEAAEREAATHGCDQMYLDTFSFQAKDFYEKLGWTVFGQLDDFPPGHSRYFLRKRVDGRLNG